MADTEFAIPHDVQRAFGLDGITLRALPADASTRRYARVAHPVHGPCLVLKDEPNTAHFENFLTIGSHLEKLGFSTPRIYAIDREAGCALIEDFGKSTYTSLLSAGHDEVPLYTLAVDTLIALQKAPGITNVDVPSYDLAFLLQEIGILAEWFAPETGRALSDSEKAEHDRLWSVALGPVAERRDTLVIRDFHVDNLMLLTNRTGIAACGLLDFQGGLIGAATYDLASLLQDARRDVPFDLETMMLDRYIAARAPLDRDAFLAEYNLIAAQRHAKVAGIFHRLNARDGKPGYLRHLPRVLNLLRRALAASDQTDILDFYDDVIPQWRK